MKKRIKSACGLLFFFFIRGGERLFSRQGFCRILNGFVFARAVVNTTFRKPKRLPPAPDFLRTPATRRAARQSHQNRYLNHFLEFFPERLAEAKWLNGCHIEGLERLWRAGQGRRPVVLAFFHFGPFFLLRFWLRAAGVPAATFVGGNATVRTRLLRFQDRFSPFPQIPTAFYRNQLRAAAGFLAAGNPLLVSIDTAIGKQVNVPFNEGWTFRMATGAMRLAARHQAELIPCCITDLGHWHFRIDLGESVPGQFLARENGWSHAGKYLLDQMLPVFRAHPEQCAALLLECWQRTTPPPGRPGSESVCAGRVAEPLADA